MKTIKPISDSALATLDELVRDSYNLPKDLGRYICFLTVEEYLAIRARLNAAENKNFDPKDAKKKVEKDRKRNNDSIITRLRNKTLPFYPGS